MKSSYTNSYPVCKLRLNLLLAFLMILPGCQIDQSVSIIKDKLFSDASEPIETQRDDNQTLKKQSDPINEKKIDNDKEVIEITDEKRNLSNAALSEENKISNNFSKKSREEGLSFKEMGKARDTDSKIVSFFTKIFEFEEDDAEQKIENPSINTKIKDEPIIDQNIDISNSVDTKQDKEKTKNFFVLNNKEKPIDDGENSYKVNEIFTDFSEDKDNFKEKDLALLRPKKKIEKKKKLNPTIWSDFFFHLPERKMQQVIWLSIPLDTVSY